MALVHLKPRLPLADVGSARLEPPPVPGYLPMTWLTSRRPFPEKGRPIGLFRQRPRLSCPPFHAAANAATSRRCNRILSRNLIAIKLYGRIAVEIRKKILQISYQLVNCHAAD